MICIYYLVSYYMYSIFPVVIVISHLAILSNLAHLLIRIMLYILKIAFVNFILLIIISEILILLYMRCLFSMPTSTTTVS